MKKTSKLSFFIFSFLLIFLLAGCSKNNNGSSTYSLNVTFPEEGGTVTKTPDRLYYKKGEKVTLTAKPEKGYALANWSGIGIEETRDNPITITMLDDVDLIAYFGKSYEFTDDFSTGDNWPDMEDEIFYAGVEDGKYVMTIKTNTTNARTVKAPYQGVLSPRGDFVADVIFEYGTPDKYTQAGLIFNYKKVDENKFDYYSLRISNMGNYTLEQIVDGDAVTIRNWTNTNVNIDGGNLLAVEKYGLKYKFFLNGSFLDEVEVEEDLPFIALLAANKTESPVTVYYDKFYINYIEKLPLSDD